VWRSFAPERPAPLHEVARNGIELLPIKSNGQIEVKKSFKKWRKNDGTSEKWRISAAASGR
jgi:hypothetical protein